MQKEYALIKNRLECLMDQGIINEYTRRTIIDMANKVLAHIAAKHDTIRKGVNDIMFGKVLEYEAKTIKREGIKEGIQGAVSILKNLNIPPQTILLQIQEQYHLSPEEARKYL